MISATGKNYLVILFFLSINIIFQNKVIASEKNDISQKSPIIETVTEDYKSFYTKQRFLRMGLVFGFGGILANTKIDANFQDWYQNNIRNSQTDDVSKIVKYFGEYEYAIPVDEAKEMLANLCEQPLIEKTRYLIQDQSLCWEIDVFKGDNEGLVVAEVELESELQQFVYPSWLGKEVSDDPRYYNVSLVKHPYKSW